MKEKRKAIGLSLRDASNLTGVSHTHIRDIEDSRSVPSFEMVKEGYSMKLCFLKKRKVMSMDNLLREKSGETVLTDGHEGEFERKVESRKADQQYGLYRVQKNK